MILTLHSPTFTVTQLAATVWKFLHGAAGHSTVLAPDSTRTSQDLGKGATLALDTPLGQRIACLEGCLWITQDRDPRDVVIAAGQSFTPDRNTRALVYALEASRVALC